MKILARLFRVPPLLRSMFWFCLFTGPLGAQPADSLPRTAAAPNGNEILARSDVRGGLIVLVGCRQADLAIALARQTNMLVHALVPDRAKLEAVRQQIRQAGLYGRVSAMAWNEPVLPYADGLVNVLVVAQDNLELADDETDRVLAPLGTAWLPDHGTITAHRKPWPTEVDDWTHARHDATGNAVSRDQRAGPPRYLQWEALPRWNHGVKTSCLVSSRGRLFYILDDSPFAVRERTWALIARDAHNGIRLWRRQLPGWPGAKGGKKVGPAQVNRRLVAGTNRVYVVPDEFGPAVVLDAASGKLVRTLEATTGAEEILLSNGILVALVNPNTAPRIRRGHGEPMRAVAVNPEDGRRLWEHPAAMILPLTLAADGRQVVFHDGKVIRSLDLKTGAPRWTSPPTGQKIAFRDKANPDSPGAEKQTILLAPQFAPTLIIYRGVVAFAGGRQLNVVSADDGRELWRAEYAASNYSVPVDLFGFEDCLWGPDLKMNLWRPRDDDLGFCAYDPLTGVIRKTVSGKYAFRFQHHRCHQMKVIGNRVVAARAGIEFLNTDTCAVTHQHWIRGSCYYGVLPANGRLYVPPHDCACYVRAKLSGFMALNSQPPKRPVTIPREHRLHRGPAYGLSLNQNETLPPYLPDDWPTYRHDPARSGRSPVRIGSPLLLGWKADPGGRLTSPVIANGRVYLASTDAHTLHALDARTGKRLWTFTMDARIDSPPTVHGPLVLCGCRDGSVYALRATDGALAWRFVACPEQRLIVSRGQLESVWPVPGSVLVLDDTVWFTAGRSSYLDGGMRLYGLNLHFGLPRIDVALATLGADGGEVLDREGVDGYLSDILSSDGRHIFLRHHVLDLNGKPQPDRIPHLHGPDGYLGADSTPRLPWTYAPMFTSPHQGAFYDVRLSRLLFPTGRILVEGKEAIYGFGQNHYQRALDSAGGQWALFAAPKKIDVPLDLTAFAYRKLALARKRGLAYRWWKRLPLQARALVRTGDALFVAGPRGSDFTTQAALDGKEDALLLAVSPDDGEVLAEMTLPSAPVWDGMAAAGDSLYVALADGQLVCLWSKATGRAGTPLPAAPRPAPLPPVKVAREPGLVGHWRFDEGVGTVARDCSGRGHDAIVAGRWARDAQGACVVADGTPRAVEIPDAPHLHFGHDDFTLAWRVRVDAYDTRLLGKEGFPQNWWVINLLDDGRAELVLGEGPGPGRSVRVPTNTPLPPGQWTHLVAVVNRKAGDVRWYVNGQPCGRRLIPQTMTAGLHAKGHDLNIPSNFKPFRGRIGELRIYRRALTAEQVRGLFPEKSTSYQ